VAEARDGEGIGSFTWPLNPVVSTSLFAALTHFNSKLLESAATAQKDWAEFVHRRVSEDVAVSQQLMSCKSLSDMQQIYAQYVRTAFDQYREQSAKVIQRSKSTADGLARTLEQTAREPSQAMRH
jgi:Phasin protein